MFHSPNHPLSPPCSPRTHNLSSTCPYTSLFETNPSLCSLPPPPPPVMSFTSSSSPSPSRDLKSRFFFLLYLKKKRLLLLPSLIPTPLPSRTAVSHDKSPPLQAP
ncbi:Hypothetical predicted protein [Octopus vulgaris]|uniref:Uncharacterized protein n=1 Tax=Octopus vulgaris TaxID=6645 RepID=A0AA36FJV1_OCTVU|nr:Hypothetical predicted protein [Octopus vulgaris]